MAGFGDKSNYMLLAQRCKATARSRPWRGEWRVASGESEMCPFLHSPSLRSSVSFFPNEQ
jgi:hypothetical protein